MPYRNAHWTVLGVLVLTFVAFWPSYFSQLPAGKSAWHVHALGAMLWALLFAVQSWSIHNGKRTIHKKAGLASFPLFVLFLVGGMMAIQAEAITLSKDLTDPSNRVIAQFGFFDPLANIGFALLFHGALKHRRNVHLHARYMAATLLFLAAPLIWRLLQSNVAFFDSSTPETAWRFSYAMLAGNLGAVAISWSLHRQAPAFGRPYLIAIGFIVAQQVLFETLGRFESWGWLFSRIAFANPPLLLGLTAAISLAIAWHGWGAGRSGRAVPAASPSGS